MPTYCISVTKQCINSEFDMNWTGPLNRLYKINQIKIDTFGKISSGLVSWNKKSLGSINNNKWLTINSIPEFTFPNWVLLEFYQDNGKKFDINFTMVVKVLFVEYEWVYSYKLVKTDKNYHLNYKSKTHIPTKHYTILSNEDTSLHDDNPVFYVKFKTPESIKKLKITMNLESPIEFS